MNRIDRLVAMLTTLQSKRHTSADYLADKYDISLRTVYRDLKALGEIGAPVAFEDQKGYSISGGYFLPPVSLSSEEAMGLILISSLSEKYADKTTRAHIGNALNKIKAVLREPDREKADELQAQISVWKPPVHAETPDFLANVQQSIIEKKVLNIQYKDNQGKTSKRDVEPIGLTFYSDQWHVIAWCWERKAYRDFKVHQITQLTDLQEGFRKQEHYSVQEYIRSIE